ncbi:MAG: tRNA CCA-pyrophosphorylase [Candidatus Bathyarchaeota archaeon]|nr:tRNA CCA-pyrophosphorylase [Candidatus Bathyarchaeota archaeon]
MDKIEVTLISGRTAKQGVGLEEGKPSESYVDSVRLIQLCPGDAEKLDLKEDSPVTVTTEHGSVTVHWVEEKTLESGMIFFPYGPWANQVYNSVTDGTGMPIMKAVKATVEAGGKVQSLTEIVDSLKGGS